MRLVTDLAGCYVTLSVMVIIRLLHVGLETVGKMRHDHNLKYCRRCGESDRSKLLRRPCVRPMTPAAKRLWLLKRGRPEILFALEVCVACGSGFFRLIVDIRGICYGC